MNSNFLLDQPVFLLQKSGKETFSKRTYWGGFNSRVYGYYKNKFDWIDKAIQENWKLAWFQEGHFGEPEGRDFSKEILWLPEKSRKEVSEILFSKLSYIRWFVTKNSEGILIPATAEESVAVGVMFGGFNWIYPKVKKGIEENKEIYFQNNFSKPDKAILKPEIAKKYLKWLEKNTNIIKNNSGR